MSPEVFARFVEVVERRLDGPPRAVLEVGAGSWTLLSMPAFVPSLCVALNLRFDRPSEQLARTERVIGSGNELPFADASFDCVVSCSVLEHDRWFWRSSAEMLRVLRPGGLTVVGVPIYMTLPDDRDHTTRTYARHGLAYNADYYRFSEQAVREVVLAGYSAVTDEIIVRTQPNPYMVAAGRK